MPIPFTCPKCGKQTVVDDQFAGQTGPCASCGTTVTIPGAPFAPAASAPPGRSNTGTILLIIFGTIGIGALLCAGLMVALLFPAVNAARDTAKRVNSMNNMKIISLAIMNYHDIYGQFPPAVVTDENGQPLYSGRVLLLPFLDEDGLYRQFDKSKAWNSPENQEISSRSLNVFLDPSSTSTNASRSDYVFVTGTGTIFESGKRITMRDITDGLSYTLAFIETSAGPSSWAEPKEWDASAPLPPGNRKHLILYALADGMVRSASPSALQKVAHDLAVRDDGKVVVLP
jgi:hypothetical protein